MQKFVPIEAGDTGTHKLVDATITDVINPLTALDSNTTALRVVATLLLGVLLG